jgi:hypothetical protein
MKTKRFTKELLDSILLQGNATLLETYTKYNQRMRVKFRCSCGVETSKRFEMLNNYRDNLKIKKLKSFFIFKFYHSNSRRTLILRKL